jgi:arabinoxylan arabinofuranohydrolase
MATVLGPDMLTIVEEPVFVLPSEPYSRGTGFEGHEYFEAPSIRKRGDTYYLIYSSIVMHELCYATSKDPTKGFKYGGVIVSNADLHIDAYKPADKPMYYGGNNHGSIVEIGDQWYIFYHRQTNGHHYSRQGCAEPIRFREDGSIVQAEMTSCGLNGGPLAGRGEYPAYIACNLFCKDEELYIGTYGAWMDGRFPKITQDGKDGDEEPGYIANMRDTATAGFKYFDCRGVKRVKIKVRGYAKGAFEVKTSWDGPALGSIPVNFTNVWKEYAADIAIPDGVHALYFTYRGEGNAQLKSFTLES